MPVKKTGFISAELRQAYLTNDAAKIREWSQKAEDDHSRLVGHMYDTQLSPWNQTTVEGKVIHFYGDEKAYIWTTVAEAEGQEPTASLEEATNEPGTGKVVPKATVEVGFYSSGGGQAHAWYIVVPRVTTDVLLATTTATVAYRSIYNSIRNLTPMANKVAEARDAISAAKKEVEVATDAAQKEAAMARLRVAEADFLEYTVAAGLEAEGMGATRAFLVRYGRILSGVGSMAAVIIVTCLFETFILPHIVQDFFVRINIVNFDKRTWRVDQWHHDNGIIAGGVRFEEVTLDPPSGRNSTVGERGLT